MKKHKWHEDQLELLRLAHWQPEDVVEFCTTTFEQDPTLHTQIIASFSPESCATVGIERDTSEDTLAETTAKITSDIAEGFVPMTVVWRFDDGTRRIALFPWAEIAYLCAGGDPDALLTELMRVLEEAWQQPVAYVN